MKEREKKEILVSIHLKDKNNVDTIFNCVLLFRVSIAHRGRSASSTMDAPSLWTTIE